MQSSISGNAQLPLTRAHRNFKHPYMSLMTTILTARLLQKGFVTTEGNIAINISVLWIRPIMAAVSCHFFSVIWIAVIYERLCKIFEHVRRNLVFIVFSNTVRTYTIYW